MIRSLGFAAALAGGLMTAGAASAMPLGPAAPVGAALVQDVSWGCGPGWHPNPWGRCVPNAPAYHYYRPVYYGWHRPVYWHRPYVGHWHRW